MSTASALDEAFQRERSRLIALAYRLVGSMADAEDVVHDALVRAHAAAPADLASPGGYLTTTTTRTALDHLRSARVRREQYVGPWLPEPVLADPAPDVSAAAELADSLSMAFLVVLESLSPPERAVLLLHDVFGVPHAEAADAVGVSVANSRQLLRRARRHVTDRRPRFPVDPMAHRRLVERFAEACGGGDLEAFVALLAEGSVYVADGGAAAKAARHPIRGLRLARFLAYVYGRPDDDRSVSVVTVNDQPALAIRSGDELTTVMFIEPAADGRIGQIFAVRNPAKLARVAGALGAVDPDSRR